MSRPITSPAKPMQWLKAMVVLAMLVLMQAHAFAQVTVTFFHNDIAGTPLAATDSAGNLAWKETYRPYGDRLTQSPASSGNGVWFAGKPQDERTGLVYMGARYYDPTIGRFMGTDPVGFVEGNVHSVNRYAYANNNPYRYVDPDGRYADLAIEAVSLTVGFHSLIGNWRESNWSGAAVDAGGIAVDVVGAVIPGIPGAAGLGIKAMREAAERAANGGGGIWRASKIDAAKMEHIFSADHVKTGIMDLGKSKDAILSQARDALMAADRAGGLRDGMNTVMTKMNGHDATVRAFFKNGEMQSMNIFKGISERAGKNVTDLR